MLTRHEGLVDAAAPVLVGAVIVTGELLHASNLRAVAIVLALAAAATLFGRRRWPGSTLGHVMLVAIPPLAAEQVRTHRAYLRVLQERLGARNGRFHVRAELPYERGS